MCSATAACRGARTVPGVPRRRHSRAVSRVSAWRGGSPPRRTPGRGSRRRRSWPSPRPWRGSRRASPGRPGTAGCAPGRGDELHDDVGEVRLQRAVALALVLPLQLRDLGAGEGGVDRQEVADAGLGLAVEADHGVGVRDRALHLLRGGLRLVEEVDQALRGGRRLAHLGGRVLKVVDLRRLLEDVRGRHGEGVAVGLVEAVREVAGQLQVLALVLADGDLVGLVQQDVGDHQHRVGEQADGGAVVALLGGLVLELRHPGGLAEAGDAVHQPAELGVLGDVALHEQGAAVRVEAGREELGGGDAGVLAQLLRVLRDRDRVQVDDHVERVVGVLHVDPLADGAEVVAEVERAGGRLDTGEHTGTFVGHAHYSLRPRGAVGHWF